jgi:predicted dehydrogenase
MKKEDKVIKVGLLGCGPIAQATHFDAIRKAKNAELYAICDLAEDMLMRMNEIHQPKVAYTDYDKMLADPNVDVIFIAVADQFHVPLALKALKAGKHVLIEKPMGVTVEECRSLAEEVQKSNVMLQVGNNRRFSPAMQDAKRFLTEEMGTPHTFEAWYFDSIYRYTMQDNLYPIPVTSSKIRRPAGDPKLNRKRYTLMTHAPHLVDRAVFMLGEVESVLARHRALPNNAQGWSIELEFKNGCLGHLILISPRHGDFEEGFRVHGENGMVQGIFLLPWYQRSFVECFKNGKYSRLIGEDDYSFRRQTESFADTILKGVPQYGANAAEGLLEFQIMVAISMSVESGKWVRIDETTGGIRAPDVEGEFAPIQEKKVA